MNSFLFSAITICLAAQCALAQYQNGGYQQRKLAPSPQQYGGQQLASYGHQENSYEEQSAYRAPSSASVSHYDERTPAASYQAPKASGYGAAKATSGYGAAPASYSAPSSYAKPAARYEEPYYPPMPFAWGYDINDGYGGAQYHKENGDEYGKRTGSYGYTDAYGIYRQVDYVADEHGFRATIKTNEPGTANESPADVELHAYEPPSNYYAGNKDSYAAAAPASYSAPAKTSGYAAAPAQASYSAAPRAQSYQQPASYQRSSYQQQARPAYRQSSGYGAEQAAQYSSSVIVPVYQKAAGKPLAAVAAKRY